MEGTANIAVYHNSEINYSTDSVKAEADTLKRVTNILYRSPIVVFGGLIQFEVMPIINETNEVQHDTDVQDDRAEAFLEMNNVSDEEFEATYITKPMIRTRTAMGEVRQCSKL
ncbi:uncharacterized protein DS421_16g542120 [Arachis hypogaea]|nr:uncharacterized protein DS421_16g542120 [Arachis hypogaea]